MTSVPLRTVSLPLAGDGVVVTRDEGPEGPLTARLATLGARVRHWPALTIQPVAASAELDRARAALATYDWIVFSSRHAVPALAAAGRPCPDSVRVAAVGPGTAEAVRAAGWPVHLVPASHTAEHLVLEFETQVRAPGCRVLFPASAIARDTIPAGLARCGALVDQVTAYQARPAALDAAECLAAVAAGDVRAVTFASPSAVHGVRQALGAEAFRQALHGLAIAVIGPTTGAAVRDQWDGPIQVAVPSTLGALADAVVLALHARSS